MLWFIYSIFALILFVAYDLFSRKIGSTCKNPRVFSAIYNFFASCATPLILFIEPVKIPNLNNYVLLLTFINLLVWWLFGRIEWHVHKHVEAGFLSIILRIAPALTFIFSIIFLKESINLTKIMGVVIILAVNVWFVVATRTEKFRYKKGFFLSILLALTLSVGWTFDKVISPYYGVMIFSLLCLSTTSMFNFLVPPASIKDIKSELKNMNILHVVVLAIINILGYGFMIKALILGEASKVIPISTATAPFVVILGVLLLNEKTFIKQKILAALLTLFGIFLLR